jgi:hypothetical protein
VAQLFSLGIAATLFIILMPHLGHFDQSVLICRSSDLHCGQIGGLFRPDFECRPFAPHWTHLYRREFSVFIFC